MNISPLCHKFAYKYWTAVEGQGHFRQITTGHTVCSVNGVLPGYITILGQHKVIE